MTIRGQWQWTLCVDSHHVIFVQPAAAAAAVCVCVCLLFIRVSNYIPRGAAM